ncbi:Hsp70 family protein [Saccharopolyspora sp. K220]|uniref:Hsp70 family protein n=1 Tax=Saccharopolyspora soli TaxID=2926618 RepID=UPI001F5A8641|nr:Hsp70 family protein [Saccharopolyspora soli]MCI2416447.1 Hsp70 family protein [Saccharopolyspora soli]
MAYNLGVDLGTTYTAAAVEHFGQVEMLTLGDRAVIAPAVVFVRADGTVVTGDAAARRAVGEPHRIAREFKRRLGDPTPLVLGGTPFSAAALLGQVLRDVLHKATETEGEPPERVVLTRPANWGPYRQELFSEVPKLAGLDEADTLTEPEAAAAYYAGKRQLPDQVVAVYDLGGGTFDATVVRKTRDHIEILGEPEGIERLGGIDFDEAILAHVDASLDGALTECGAEGPESAAALRRLQRDCAEAKEALSLDTEATIQVFLPQRHYEVTITRDQFEEMIRAPIEATIDSLRRALRSAQVTADDLSAVLLVGGSSRIPLVARMVSEELGRPTAVDTHPKYAVALGAAALAADHEGAREPPAPQVPVEVAAPPPPPEEPGPPTERGEPPPRRRKGAYRGLIAAGVLLIVLGLLTSFSLFDAEMRRAQEQTGEGSVPTLVRPPVAGVGPIAASSPTPEVAGGIGVAAPRGIALTPDGRAAYVTSRNTSRVSVVDTAAGSVSTSLFQSVPPQFVAVTPDGRRAYVSAYPQTGPENLVFVLDVATNTVQTSIQVGKHPYTLTASTDGSEVWVPDHDSAQISIIDTTTNKVADTIEVKPNPHSVAFTPDGRTAYVANHDSNLVTVIDTATRSIEDEVAVPPSPHNVAMSPDGRTVAVCSYDAASASTIDTKSRRVTGTIPVGTKPSSVAYAPDGRHFYVVNEGSNSLSVVDPKAERVTATVPVGEAPVAVALSPDGRQAYVTNVNSNTVSVLNTAG